MKKICHLTSAHNSNDVRIFYKECTSLAKAGYDTYLIARGESREENGVHIIGVGTPPSGRLKRMMIFAKKVYMAALALDADIYHLHDPELLSYGLKLKRHGKKVIFDSHEDTLNQMSQKHWIPGFLRPIISTIYKKYAGGVFKHFDALISVTPHIVDGLKQINPNTWQITNYPIIDSNVCEDNSDCPHDSICFTGGIGAQWSHTEILAALEQLKHTGYVMCGRASDEYLAKLRQLPGWQYVRYLGMVTYEESLSIQKKSLAGMALLKPSNNTGNMQGTIGNTKLFEYMMNGLPVVCTNFELWEEIIEKYQCGICVSPADITAIAQAIESLRSHPGQAQKMGRNGKLAVDSVFNWSTQESKLIALYKSL